MEVRNRERMDGDVEDVSFGGAGVRFTKKAHMSVPIGSKVRVLFSGPILRREIIFDATVRFRVDEEGQSRYGVRFDRPEQTLAPSAQALFRIFNRRKHYRVKPHSEQLTTLLLRVEAGPNVPAELLDVSAGGLGVSAHIGVDEQFVSAEAVNVALALSEEAAPLDLVASIRSRTMVSDESVRYGLAFDPEATEGFAAKHERIMDYVMARQREELASGVVKS